MRSPIKLGQRQSPRRSEPPMRAILLLITLISVSLAAHACAARETLIKVISSRMALIGGSERRGDWRCPSLMGERM